MDNFVWDGVSSDEDFFASVEKEDKEKDDKTSAENVVKEINKDNDEEQNIIPKTDEESAEEEGSDFFAETDNTPTGGDNGEEEPGNPEGGSEEGKSKKEKSPRA